ncbi:MAG TPA: DUF4258 domain-containing protein [Pyrinomonadaceae bacterium]|jgi:hypothetical protein
MKVSKYRISSHAARRMAQRNLSVGDVALILRFGRKEHRTGVKFFFLGDRDLPPGQEREMERLVGTTVVAADACILTVYRNEKALARIKRKLKWRWSMCKRKEAGCVSFA